MSTSSIRKTLALAALALAGGSANAALTLATPDCTTPEPAIRWLVCWRLDRRARGRRARSLDEGSIGGRSGVSRGRAKRKTMNSSAD